jgi:hypothetical protein
MAVNSNDIRNLDEPHFYVTEDSASGALQRFTLDVLSGMILGGSCMVVG